MNEITKIKTILETEFPTFKIYSGLTDEREGMTISFIPNIAGDDQKTANAIPFYSPSYTIYIQGNGLHSESYQMARAVYAKLYRYSDNECYISAQSPTTFEGLTESGVQVFTFEIILYNRERG